MSTLIADEEASVDTSEFPVDDVRRDVGVIGDETERMPRGEGGALVLLIAFKPPATGSTPDEQCALLAL